MSNYQLFLTSFREIFPRCQCAESLCTAFFKEFPLNNITTLNRACMFIAQCGHESAGFTVFSENLNYSASALTRVFPKYFKENDVDEYARKPEKIANLVYANRMGNGDESSGDGYKYRGRGLIQLTGKQNYTLCSKFCDVDLVGNPDLVALDLRIAVKSALWFWTKNNLNKICDRLDFKLLTRRINGGLNGYEDRERLYRLCLEKFRTCF